MGICLVGGCTRETWHTYACEQCTERVRRQLREIETHTQIMTATRSPGRSGSPGERRSPGFESRSPARDDVLVALDYRSSPTASGPDDQDNPVRSVLGTLHGITRWLREMQGVDEPRTPPTVTSEIVWLLPQIEWCAAQQWVDELAADVAELHRQTRRLAADAPPKAVGRCLMTGCVGTVYTALLVAREGGRIEGGRCAECRCLYDWLHLVRIRVIENRGTS